MNDRQRSTTQAPVWMRTAAIVLMMVATVLSASGFVIGGMLVGADGPTAMILLAAAVPLTALLWVISMSRLFPAGPPADQQRPPRSPAPSSSRVESDSSESDEWEIAA